MSYTLVLEWMPGDLYMSAVTARCTAPTSSYSVVWLPPNKVYQITLYCGSTSLVSFLVGAFRGKAWSYMSEKLTKNMSEKLTKKSVAHNYAFLAIMLGSMILGSIVGAIFPQVKEGDEVVKAGATVLKPLGTLFINMMFCIGVPWCFLPLPDLPPCAAAGGPARSWAPPF